MLKLLNESMHVSSNSLKPQGELKPNLMWHHHWIREEMESSFKLFSLFAVSHYCQPRGRGHLAGTLPRILPAVQSF